MPNIEIIYGTMRTKEVLCHVVQQDTVPIRVAVETLFLTVSDEALNDILPAMKEAYLSGKSPLTVFITKTDEEIKKRVQNVVFEGELGCPGLLQSRKTECLIFQEAEKPAE